MNDTYSLPVLSTLRLVGLFFEGLQLRANAEVACLNDLVDGGDFGVGQVGGGHGDTQWID